MAKKTGETKVRIGRGAFGGRVITFEEGADLRPTLSRIRDAVFSMVTPYTDTHAFMDLCAGSGVMGFEACGMGFEPTWLLDTSAGAVKTLERNARTLGAEVHIAKTSALTFQEWDTASRPWLIFADPPYRMKDFHGRMLASAAQAQGVAPGSLYVAEFEDGAPAPEHPDWPVLKAKRYGRVRITILEKRSES